MPVKSRRAKFGVPPWPVEHDTEDEEVDRRSAAPAGCRTTADRAATRRTSGPAGGRRSAAAGSAAGRPRGCRRAEPGRPARRRRPAPVRGPSRLDDRHRVGLLLHQLAGLARGVASPTGLVDLRCCACAASLSRPCLPPSRRGPPSKRANVDAQVSGEVTSAKRVAVALRQRRPLAVEPLVDLDGTPEAGRGTAPGRAGRTPRRCRRACSRSPSRAWRGGTTGHPSPGCCSPGTPATAAGRHGTGGSRRAPPRPAARAGWGSQRCRLRRAAWSAAPAGTRPGRAETWASGKACAELAHLASLVPSSACSSLRSGEGVLERPVAQLDGGVLHREQVLDLVVQALPDQPTAVRERRVQQGRDEPVALVEVRLPVERVVLVGPRDVPDRRTGQRDRREAGRLGTQAVLGVVPLDEQRQAEPDLADHLASGSGT